MGPSTRDMDYSFEKEALMERSQGPVFTKPRRHRWVPPAAILAVLALFTLWQVGSFVPFSKSPTLELGNQGATNIEDWCPLPKVQTPEQDGLKSSDHFNTPEVLKKQVERLSAAVKVPTESFDDNGDVDEDPRWASFPKLHKVLEDLFPLVHTHFTLRKINRYGLLYTLNGTNDNLKPILLTAHQDVVPAGIPSRWTYPPFSPHYDGTFLWGRGSTDCKNVLIGILSALESLLSQSFTPRRTIVLAFGFDEEAGGMRGARTLSQALESEWGLDAFEFLLDEGGMGIVEVGDVAYALPGVGEKGYHDVSLTLRVDGGHSSRPPSHTAIGIMSEMVVALEREPYPPRLTQENPFRRVLECRTKYSPGEVEPWLKSGLLSGEETAIAEQLAEESPEERWLMQTSQAVTIIEGGVKVNALPEMVELMVNHRVAPHDGILAINEHVRKVLEPVAKRFGIEVLDRNDVPSESSVSSLTFEYPQTLDIAPISPTNNEVWALFSGTLRSVLEDSKDSKAKMAVPVGDVMTGNTDTQYYWNLTRNIYRFTPSRDGTRLNTHAIDERMGMSAHVEGMRVYYDLIRNFDAWDGK